MKGILTKTDNSWQVSHATYNEITKRWIAGKLPLHPDDVKQINADAQVFDNIEARIAAYPEVDFKFYEIWEEVDGETKITKYAKLINQESTCEYSGLPSTSSYTTIEYPELEGTINLCTDIINKKRTGKMTEEE
jgi:hypothetical protein